MSTYAIILNFNSAEETLALYRQLKEFYREELEILVVDNDSKTYDKALLKEFVDREDLIFNKVNLGYAGGNNIGISKAINNGAKNIWVLNPDIRVEKDTLSILKATLERDYKKIAAVGPRINYRNEVSKIFSDGGLFLKDEKCTTDHKHQGDIDSIHLGTIDCDIDYVDGSCILLNADVIKEIGSFPEEYFLYFEETDWCLRAKSYGYSLCIDSNAKAFNINSEKGKTFHYYMMKNRLLFAKKYHPDLELVKRFYLKTLVMELLMRFKRKYFKPFYFSRLKGFVSGYLKTL